jgi:acyl-coenzyme A synthetase/AMP-(fatty) acid ligase
MLYERWRRVAHEFEREIALRDLATAEAWTFGQLAKLTEKADLPAGPIAFPTGMSAQFVFDVLKGWRAGQVICPLEPGQGRPSIASLPPGVVHLKLTSATTGSHKLVAFTAAQIAADADNIVQTMGLRADWPNIGLISLAHSYGFSNLITPLLLHGIPLLVGNSALPEAIRVASRISSDGFTLAGVPALWRIWHEAGVLTGSVRLAISAGAPLPLTLEEVVWQRSQLKIHNFYGATECGGIAFDRSMEPRKDAAYVGSAMQNVRLSVGANDRLEVRGASAGETYWPKPLSDLRKGLFRTSDIVELRGDEVYLRGRLTDQINVAGRKVFPEAIERVLMSHPEVRDCLVFGVASSKVERAENIVACVVTRQPIGIAALEQFAVEQLPMWQVPRRWWFLPEIPKNNRGKIGRGELRKAYLEAVKADCA